MAAEEHILLKRWIDKRDARAFKTIVSLYGGMVFAVAKRVLRDSAEAEDTAQEVFEQVACLSRMPKSPLGSWLHRVAMNRALDRLKATRRRKAREERFAKEAPAITQPTWNDIYAHIDEAIAQLPDKFRFVIVAHYLESKSQTAIAHELGVSRTTITYRLRVGIGKIKATLKRRGIGIASGALAVMLAANVAEAAPVTLAASLGKTALAAACEATPAVGQAGLATAGGALLMKKAVLTAALVLAAASVFWAADRVTSPSASQASRFTQETDGPKGGLGQAESSALHEEDDDEAGGTVPSGRFALDADESAIIPVSGGEHEGAVLAGIVIDQGHRPVNEATVWISGSGISDKVETDAEGIFLVPGLPPQDRLHLKAYKENLSSSEHVVRLVTGERTEVLLVVHPAGKVSGTVLDVTGRPVAGLHVSAHQIPQNWSGMPGHDAITDSAGRFEIHDLTAGTFRLTDGSQGTLRYWQDDKPAVVEVAVGQRREGLRLVHGSGYAISGYVTDPEGIPLEGVRVSAGEALAHTDDNGWYELTGLDAGEYEVHAQFGSGGYGTIDIYGVRAGSTEGDIVMYPGYGVAGRVVDAETNEAIRDFEIACKSHNYERYDGHITSAFQPVHDEDGRFETKRVNRGWVVTVAARAPGFATAIETLRLTPGEQVTDLVLALEPGGTLKGIVRNSAGLPVPQAKVYYGRVLGTTSPRTAAATTDADGRFILESHPSASVLLTAFHPDYSRQVVRVPEPSRPAKPLVVVLTSGGEVEGSVWTSEGTVARVRVAQRGNLDYVETKPAPDGTYRIAKVPVGEAEASVIIHYGRSQGDRVFSRPIIVGEGETTQVDFDVPPATGVIEGSMLLGDRGINKIAARLTVSTARGEDSRTLDASPDGQYRIENVPAGILTLQFGAYLQSGEFLEDIAHFSFDIGDGEVVRQDIVPQD